MIESVKGEARKEEERAKGISGGWMVDWLVGWLSITTVKMFNLPIAGIGLCCALKSNSIEMVLGED